MVRGVGDADPARAGVLRQGRREHCRPEEDTMRWWVLASSYLALAPRYTCDRITCAQGRTRTARPGGRQVEPLLTGSVASY